MKIDILDIERLISVNNLQEVTSSWLFSNKTMFDPEGILSNDIFGISKADRRNTFAYINLKRHFIHPHMYSKVLKGIFRGVMYIVSGQKRFLVKDGILVEDEDGWTGIESLYDHWDEIDWSKSKSVNNINKNLLIKLKRDQIFITKMLVCPPAYRDVMIAGTVDSSDHVNELNDMYIKLIRSVALLSEGGLFARTQYATQMKIQDIIVNISDYFKQQISRKYGLIRKNLLGKSIDYGVRTVISAPNYNNECINDNIIDVEHSAVPISEACSIFYPFIEAWLKNFFTREIINDPNLITYYDVELGKEITATMKDADVQFSEKNIRKLINDYVFNPDNRFRVITVDVNIPKANGDEIKKAYMILKGKINLPNNIQKVLNRAMTVTDILYIACVDVCEKRHIMVSRYPVGTDKGIFFNKIRIQSTTDHVQLILNGKEYPFYPDIDLKIPHEKVGALFIDTLVMSNSHLDGMGADYDGDQVSLRGLWSDEANLEAEEIMNKKMSALNITGSNSKGVAKEVFNSMYELTKIGNKGKDINKTDQNTYLNLTPDNITRTLLTDMFADTVDCSIKNQAGKRKAKHNTWDRIDIPKDYFFKGQEAMTITIGRFIFNKFILESSNIIGHTGVLNTIMNKGSLGFLDNKIGQLYMEDKITRGNFNEYLDHRDTLGYWLNGMLAHSISEKMLKPLPAVEKRKAELCKKYEKELAAGDIDVMTKISNELVDYAKEILKDDPGMDLYLSGDLDFGNNYKNNSIVKGAVKNQITGEFDFISTSFMNGIDIKDVPAHANSILSAQYPASCATSGAGYLGKKLMALLQMMEVDETCPDCGTKNLIPIKITKHNKNDLIWSYIDNGSGQEELLTDENVDQYVGKTMMFRSPMSCINQKICSKCAGKLFHLLDVKHAGLFATQISHSALNLGLKAKHNSLVELYTLNPDELIEDI